MSDQKEIIWYDDAFKVLETRFGLFVSEMKDGRRVITAPDLDSCVSSTRFHLKGEQEGWPEPAAVYSGSVGVKL